MPRMQIFGVTHWTSHQKRTEYIRPGPLISKTLLLEPSIILLSVPGHTNALYCVLRINIYYTKE